MLPRRARDRQTRGAIEEPAPTDAIAGSGGERRGFDICHWVRGSQRARHSTAWPRARGRFDGITGRQDNCRSANSDGLKCAGNFHPRLEAVRFRTAMQPTNIFEPAYFHKVVDCQWACPAHTPVPEYIRLIAQEKYTEAYMLNWDSNVFPGFSAARAIARVNPRADASAPKEAGRDLSVEARRRRQQRRHHAVPAASAHAKERQARCTARLGSGVARSRTRSAAARLRSAHVREGSVRRRMMERKIPHFVCRGKRSSTKRST